MRQPERSHKDALDRTWNRTLDVTPAGPVRMVRVQIVGTDPGSESAVTAASFGSTKRYPSILPSHEDCIAQPDTAYDDRDWRVLSGRDVSFFTDDPQQAMAFARTLPAITREELGFEESGVHEIDRLRLTLDPDCLTPTLRMKPCAEAPHTRAWQRWENQSPFIAIGTAATFCVLSALVVSLLAP
jgi:hypothetical protein